MDYINMEEDLEKRFGSFSVVTWRVLVFECLACYRILMNKGYTPEESRNLIKNHLQEACNLPEK